MKQTAKRQTMGKKRGISVDPVTPKKSNKEEKAASPANPGLLARALELAGSGTPIVQALEQAQNELAKNSRGEKAATAKNSSAENETTSPGLEPSAETNDRP